MPKKYWVSGNQLRGVLLWLSLTFLIGVLLPAGEACDREVPLQIENRTDTVLTIYTQGVYDGQVEPNKSIKVKNISATFGYLLIEAKNTKGEVVYSRKLAYYQLVDADWKVVIPPLQSE